MTVRRRRATAEARIVVRRPRSEVFAVYSDFANMQRFLGDVLAVRRLGPRRSRWTIALPFGMRTAWTTVVTALDPGRRVAFRAVVVVPIARWDVRFADVGDATRVSVRMRLPGGRFTAAALALVGKRPQAEVQADLERLRELLETGRVTDDEHVTGKRFGPD